MPSRLSNWVHSFNSSYAQESPVSPIIMYRVGHPVFKGLALAYFTDEKEAKRLIEYLQQNEQISLVLRLGEVHDTATKIIEECNAVLEKANEDAQAGTNPLLPYPR